MPKGIIAGILTLIASAFLVLFLNTGIAPGAVGLGKSGEPLLAGGAGELVALLAIAGVCAFLGRAARA